VANPEASIKTLWVLSKGKRLQVAGPTPDGASCERKGAAARLPGRTVVRRPGNPHNSKTP